VRIGWLFGLIGYLPGKQIKKSEEKAKKPKPPKNKKKFKLETIFKVLKVRGLFKQIGKLIKGLFRSFEVKHLSGRLTLGLEDPSDQGYVFAITIPINYLLSLTRYRIQIEPVFEAQYVFEYSADGQIKLYPIKTVGVLLAFIFSLPFFMIAKVLFTKWK